LKFAYSLLGFKHSPEDIDKFKLKTISLEHKKLLSLVHKDKIVSQATKNKLSIAGFAGKFSKKITHCLL
jgi:hypothetical protein